MTLGTRIVVMKDGVVQQIDSPQNLYERPCNLFVAGFMGSPQMNFLDATVRVLGSRAYLEIEGQSIPLSEEKSRPLIDGGWDGRDVILGIRPEDILETEDAFASQGYSFRVTCNVYELLGAEVFLYFELGDKSVTARVEPDTRVRPGDSMTVTFDTDKIHVFDKETEEAIVN
jgi:multiple sugar transport system ATP-binding protein